MSAVFKSPPKFVGAGAVEREVCHLEVLPMLAISLSPCLAATSAESLAFLEENWASAGVHTLCSGLQYRVLNNSTAERSPTLDTPITMHWEGYGLAAWQNDGSPFYTTRAGDGPMPLTAAEGVIQYGSNPDAYLPGVLTPLLLRVWRR
jgi:hypothetical protein